MAKNLTLAQQRRANSERLAKNRVKRIPSGTTQAERSAERVEKTTRKRRIVAVHIFSAELGEDSVIHLYAKSPALSKVASYMSNVGWGFAQGDVGARMAQFKGRYVRDVVTGSRYTFLTDLETLGYLNDAGMVKLDEALYEPDQAIAA